MEGRVVLGTDRDGFRHVGFAASESANETRYLVRTLSLQMSVDSVYLCLCAEYDCWTSDL